MKTVIEMIEREMKDKRITKRSLSRKMDIHNTTLQSAMNAKTFKVHRLIEICKIIDYNFFSEIAEGLSVKDPVTEKRLQLKDEEYKSKIEALKNEIKELKDENKILQVKFELLESVIDKLGGTR